MLSEGEPPRITVIQALHDLGFYIFGGLVVIVVSIARLFAFKLPHFILEMAAKFLKVPHFSLEARDVPGETLVL